MDEISDGRIIPQAQTDAALRREIERSLPASIRRDAVLRHRHVERELARRKGELADDGIIDWSLVGPDGSLPETDAFGTLTDNPGPHRYTFTFTNPWDKRNDPWENETIDAPRGWRR